MGGGWKSRNALSGNIYGGYKLSAEMTKFVRFVSESGGIGCRDWYTQRMLKEKGISNVVMTGCPAWYDLEKIEGLKLKDKYKDCSVRDDITIGISDPAMPWNQSKLFDLIQIMQKNFPKARLKVFFHRGLQEGNLNKMRSMCEKNENISYVDMSGSCKNFEDYNDCFLHIGFRVHAHIYNLSQGNVTILINEDARGNGVNHALGIENINCGWREIGLFKKNYMQFDKIVMDYIQYILESDYLQYRTAYLRMKETYLQMESFIKEAALN